MRDVAPFDRREAFEPVHQWAPREVIAAVELLASADVSTCGHAELDELRAASGRVREFVERLDAAVRRVVPTWSPADTEAQCDTPVG